MKLAAPSPNRPAAGIMLVECMVYVALFAVVTGLAFAAYYRSEQTARSLHRNATDILRVVKTGEIEADDPDSVVRLSRIGLAVETHVWD